MIVYILGIKSMTKVSSGIFCLILNWIGPFYTENIAKTILIQTPNATLGSSRGERLLERPLLTPEPEKGNVRFKINF